MLVRLGKNGIKECLMSPMRAIKTADSESRSLFPATYPIKKKPAFGRIEGIPSKDFHETASATNSYRTLSPEREITPMNSDSKKTAALS